MAKTNPWDAITDPVGTVAAVAESAIAKNQKTVAENTDELAAARRFGFDSVAEFRKFMQDNQGLTEEKSAAELALEKVALEVSGVDLFNYDQPLPSWVPKEIRGYLKQGELRDLYDPFYGALNNEGDERVYMGTKTITKTVRDPDTAVKSGAEGKLYGDSYAEPQPDEKTITRDKTMTVAQAVNLPYSWSDEERHAAMTKFRKAGFKVSNFDEFMTAWTSVVDRAAKMYTTTLGERKVTPWDVLELAKAEAKRGGAYTNYENGKIETTYTSVSEISEGQSWQVLQQTLQTLLGRDPSDQELRDYAYRMNTLAAQNPSVTEQVSRYKQGELVSQRSSTTGGFDAADMAQEAYEQAQDDPEYAKIQAGTTYFNALMQAVGAVGEV